MKKNQKFLKRKMRNVTFHSQVVSTEDVPAGMTELDIVNTANYFREETPT